MKTLATQSVMPPMTVSHAQPAAASKGIDTRSMIGSHGHFGRGRAATALTVRPPESRVAKRSPLRSRPTSPGVRVRSRLALARHRAVASVTSHAPATSSRSMCTVLHTCCGEPRSGAPRIDTVHTSTVAVVEVDACDVAVTGASTQVRRSMGMSFSARSAADAFDALTYSARCSDTTSWRRIYATTHR